MSQMITYTCMVHKLDEMEPRSSTIGLTEDDDIEEVLTLIFERHDLTDVLDLYDPAGSLVARMSALAVPIVH